MISFEQVEKLRRAYEAASAAEKALHETLKRVCPLGATICYEKSHGVECCGEVVWHAYGEKVKVRAESQKEYWVSAYQILKAYGEVKT